MELDVRLQLERPGQAVGAAGVAFDEPWLQLRRIADIAVEPVIEFEQDELGSARSRLTCVSSAAGSRSPQYDLIFGAIAPPTGEASMDSIASALAPFKTSFLDPSNSLFARLLDMKSAHSVFGEAGARRLTQAQRAEPHRGTWAASRRRACCGKGQAKPSFRQPSEQPARR